MMTPEIPDPAKIAEVDGVGQGSRNSAARCRVAVVRSPTYVALQEATRERERGRWRSPMAKKVEGGGQVEEGSWNCGFLSLHGAPFI
jgi:hypothetical protein